MKKYSKIFKLILMGIMVLLMLASCATKDAESDEIADVISDDVSMDNVVSMGDTGAMSLFPGTIFEELELYKTTWGAFKDILEERGLEYDEYEPNTTIRDEFYDYEAYYAYAFGQFDESEEEENPDNNIMGLIQAIVLLKDDEEYRDATKLIKDRIEGNVSKEYESYETTYDAIDGPEYEGTCYPIREVDVNGQEYVEFVIFGQLPHYNDDYYGEGVEHIIFLTFGAMPKEVYEKGYIPTMHMEGTITPIEIEEDNVIVNQEIEENGSDSEMNQYTNYAFFWIQTNDPAKLYDGNHVRGIVIASVHNETGEVKFVSVDNNTYMNVNDDTYNSAASSYRQGGAEQTLNMLNQNMDLNINQFVAINYITLSQIVNDIGGIWIDVNLSQKEMDNIAMRKTFYDEFLGCSPELTNGHQLLTGEQAVVYSLGGLSGDESCAARQLDVIEAIEVQMSQMDEESRNSLFAKIYMEMYTSLSEEEWMQWSESGDNNSIKDSEIFPQESLAEYMIIGSSGRKLVPITLEDNVVWLHNYLFEQDNYSVTQTVQEYSNEIESKVDSANEQQISRIYKNTAHLSGVFAFIQL